MDMMWLTQQQMSTDNLIKQSHGLGIQISKQSDIAKTRIEPFLLSHYACLLIYTHSKAFCVTVASKEKKK